MKAISVIIVNFNGEKYLADCLSSLSAQTFRDFEVIVVDNGSSDGSRELITRDFPAARVIALGENTGFAKGNNIGFRASSSPFVATLNNDTIADGRWLEGLYRAAEAGGGRVGMVASKIFLGREGKVLDSAGMLVYPDGMTRQRGRGEEDEGRFDGPAEVLFPSACAALYRREMLEEIGYFDEEFFSYCEDADLGLRGRLAGWQAVLAPEATVRHLYSQTGGSYSLFKAYHVERNHLWVLLKDLPLSYILLFPLYTFWRYLIQLYGILSDRGSAARFAGGSSMVQLISTVVKAYAGALAGLPGVLGKRKVIWNSRRLPAGEYRAFLRRHRISARELILKD